MAARSESADETEGNLLKMRILVTNDDGIFAPGLEILRKIASELAGPDGDVWTVAPDFEQSGTAHCITFVQPLMIEKFGPKKFAVRRGMPADCVLLALHEIIDGRPPDLVLSGINRGNNSGENVLYSGTIGAAMEAALQGVKSIALSQYIGPKNKDPANQFDAAERHALQIVRSLLKHAPWDDEDYKLFINVNFPPCPPEAVSGTSFVPQGFRKDAKFRSVSEIAPNGRRIYWLQGGPQSNNARQGTDVHANHENRISITPMRADLTDGNAMATLAARMQ